MPKTKQPKKRRVAPVQKEQVIAAAIVKPVDPLEQEFIPLVMEERDRLNQIFADPAFRKAWRNMRLLRPTAFVSTGGELGNQAAVNRFHEQRGWEAWEKAFIAQSKEPKPKTAKPQDNFPAGGTMDAAFQQPAPQS